MVWYLLHVIILVHERENRLVFVGSFSNYVCIIPLDSCKQASLNAFMDSHEQVGPFLI
jgi:hypothetical protein